MNLLANSENPFREASHNSRFFYVGCISSEAGKIRQNAHVTAEVTFCRSLRVKLTGSVPLQSVTLRVMINIEGSLS
jgi:hypothetical protein